MQKVLILLALIVQASSLLVAQNTPRTEISGNFQNRPLSEVITDLQKKYDINFSYLDQALENKYVSVSLQRQSLGSAVSKILRGTNLAFQLFDSKSVVIFKKESTERFELSGRVVEKGTEVGIPFANVSLPSLGIGDVADSSGYFRIDRVPPDAYDVRFQLIGYRENTKRITLAESTTLNAELEIEPLLLQTVEITPGIIQITAGVPAVHALSSQEILHAPNYASDVFRSIQVLPGIGTTDFRARPNIKGGNPNETSIFLDQMEIFEPFHLYELEGVTGIINTRIVQNVKLMTGGFSAKYTDKTSGIIEVSTIDEEQAHTVDLSADFVFNSLVVRKQINAKAAFFLSARRSNLDLFGLDDDELRDPIIYDLWSKLNYQINPRNRLSLNFLLSRDKEGYDDPQALIRPEFFDSLRRSYYGWLNWRWFLRNNLFSTLTLGFQDLKKSANFKFEPSLSDGNVDNRRSKILSVRQDTFLEWSPRHSAEFGVELNKFSSDYFFSEIRTNHIETTAEKIVVDSLLVDSEISGHTLSGFVQDTWEVSNRLKLLAGLRFSTQSFTNDVQLAPRASISYDLRENLNLKLAYGWYYQTDNFQKLRSYEGQRHPRKIVSKSIHYLAELDYHLPNTTVRLTGYFKDYKRLQEDYDLDFFNRYDQDQILDKPFNPVSGYSLGLETFIRHQYFDQHLFSLAYSFATNRIKNQAGQVVPRDYDRTHAMTISNILALKRGITISALWRFHTGEPYTPTEIRTIGDRAVGGDAVIYYLFGRKNSKRLPAYHSLDLRVGKSWQFTNTSLSLYFNIINIYNRNNVRSYYWDDVTDHSANQVIGFMPQERGFFDRFFVLGVGVSF